MTKKCCDLCGKEITKAETSYAKMVIADSVLGPYVYLDLHTECATRLNNKINSFLAEAQAKSSFEARWEYWPGWGGNHDKRIEDAKCSRCGYNHPTVRGTPKLLSDVCPRCKSKMDKGDNDD